MKHPIDIETLIGYWLGELESDEVEDHLFACAACSERLEEIAALAGGIRAAVREGRVAAVISGPFLEALRRQGLRLREYRVPPGGSVECTLRAEDDGVVSTVEASLAGVERLDMLLRVEVGDHVVERRVEDVPFDPDAGELIVLPPAAELRKLPAHTQLVRLVAMEDAGERMIGEYTFVHTPG
jgi:hypothetical protein